MTQDGDNVIIPVLLEITSSKQKGTATEVAVPLFILQDVAAEDPFVSNLANFVKKAAKRDHFALDFALETAKIAQNSFKMSDFVLF